MFHVRFKTLVAYENSLLGHEKRARVERHLSRCVRCRNEFDGLREMTDVLSPSERNLETIFVAEAASTPCSDPSTLYRFLTGKLPEEETREVRAHLLDCGACSHLVESFAEETPEPVVPKPSVTAVRRFSPQRTRPMRLRWELGGAVLACALAFLFLWQASLPPSLSFYLLGQKKYFVRSGNGYKLFPGEVLHAGDKFRVQVTPGEDLYCYLFLFTSSSSAQILFPASDVRLDNPLKKGIEQAIPPAGFWPLDGQKGTETVFIVSSRDPLEQVERIPAGMLNAAESFQEGGSDIKAVEAYLRTRCGSGVASFSLEHR